jgi:predicted NBD/HSP70 family sugar kinase
LKVPFQSAKTSVIAALLQHDRLSRLELSELTGVSPAGITELTQKLLQQKLLAETPAAVSEKRRGRPTVQLSMQPGHSCFVGINLGEGETLLAITDLKGEVLARGTVPPTQSPAEIPEAVRRTFVDALRSTSIPRSRVRGAGIAVAGIVDAQEGICRYSAALDWRDIPIARMISDVLELPAWADNDANGVAIGEHIFGNARDYDHFSSIVLGRTIGSAHYMHGILYRGHDGSAGEIGHITVDPQGPICRCGRNGCLDTIAGGFALRQAARESGLDVQGMRDLEELAMRGDRKAAHLLRSAGKALGGVVASLVHINNPKAVLFTDLEGFENGVFRTATRQAIENGIMPRYLGSTKILFTTPDPVSLPRGAASIAAFNYLIAL